MHVMNKVLVVVVACGFIACVPKRKFDDLNTKYQMEKEQRAETNKKLGEVEANLNELLTKRTEEENAGEDNVTSGENDNCFEMACGSSSVLGSHQVK